MREFRFTLTEYDADSSWIVLDSRQQSVELEDGVSFFAWAAETWPSPRYSVELAPWE